MRTSKESNLMKAMRNKVYHAEKYNKSTVLSPTLIPPMPRSLVIFYILKPFCIVAIDKVSVEGYLN